MLVNPCFLKHILPIVLGSIFLLISNLHAQSDSTKIAYSTINEDLFVQTKWKYTYTTHAESNTIIHKAEEDYEYFVFFKYDYTYQTYLNGKFMGGDWKLNAAQNEVQYNFRNITWWRIASFTNEVLVLEYTMNRKSSYRYHFVRVSTEEAPFQRSPNDLPDVDVDLLEKPKETNDYLAFLKKRGVKYNQSKWEKRKARQARRKEKRKLRLSKTARGRQKLEEEAPKELLQVELVGGGFFGGVDPVYKNIILIKTDGRVIQEYETALQGLRVSKHNIHRDSLERLVDYIINKDFFTFDQVYTCQNQLCNQKLSGKPRPIALRIAITKGPRRKIVTIPMWNGEGIQKSLIDYPPALDDIVRAIQTITTPPVE